MGGRRGRRGEGEDGVVDEGEEEGGGGSGGNGDGTVVGELAGRGKGEILAVGSGGEEDPTAETHWETVVFFCLKPKKESEGRTIKRALR